MKPITNQIGKLLAYQNDVSPSRKEIRSRSNALLGYFNPTEGHEGKTHDKSGRVIGNGDQRGRFIAGCGGKLD